jgi:hypothetical protein
VRGGEREFIRSDDNERQRLSRGSLEAEGALWWDWDWEEEV